MIASEKARVRGIGVFRGLVFLAAGYTAVLAVLVGCVAVTR